MHIIDIIIVITYLTGCIFIGLHKSKSITTLKEYTLGGGYFSNLVITTTLFCTYIGASDTIGVVGQISTYGIFFIIPLFFAPMAWLFMAQVYGKNISKFRGCISISDIMEKLYGKAGKWVTNVVTLSLAVVVTTTQSTAIGTIAHYYFSIPIFWGTAIGALIVVFYSATGGIRAVAATDVFQFAVLIIAIPVACSYIYRDVGGYSGIVHSLPKDMLRLDINMNNIALFLSLILFNLLPETSGTFVQRFLMSKSNTQLTKCLRVVAAIHFPFIIFLCIIGLCVKIKAQYIEPDDVLIYFISHYIVIGIKGLIISGLLAAMMSTADSFLNNAGVLCARDIIASLIRLEEKRVLLIARITTVVIGVTAIFLSIAGKGIMELLYLATNFESIIFISLTAGFLGFKTNSRSFIAATIFATLCTGISGYIVGDLGTISFLCGMVGSAVGLFGMHYWQLYQGTLNISKQQHAEFTKDAVIYDNIKQAETKENNYGQIFEDAEKQVRTIDDQLKAKSFIMDIEKSKKEGMEKGLMEVAYNLLLQGFDTETIERITGISRADLIKLQQENK